jgi:tRNA(fMet)-specific endonuclease VapC
LTRLLLDTTFLVDADRSKVSLDHLIVDDDEVAIAAITIAELLVGVLLADDAHRADRQQFVEEVRDTIPIVDYDATVAAAQAELLVVVRHQGRPRGAHDLIIAATANATQRGVIRPPFRLRRPARCRRAIPPVPIDGEQSASIPGPPRPLAIRQTDLGPKSRPFYFSPLVFSPRTHRILVPVCCCSLSSGRSTPDRY